MASKRTAIQLADFAQTVEVKDGQGRVLSVPLTKDGSKQVARFEVAQARAVLGDWFKKNRGKTNDLQPKQLKEIMDAVKVVQEMADKAYSDDASQTPQDAPKNDAGNFEGILSEVMGKAFQMGKQARSGSVLDAQVIEQQSQPEE